MTTTEPGRVNVTWIDGERSSQDKSDPRFPDGMDADCSSGASAACKIALPYPAKRCGIYLIECGTCGGTFAVTTAGRADDPRSLKVACRRH
jgi:hypothetical protein